MSSPSAPAPRLWTLGGFRDDDWVHGESAEALASNARVILPLAAYLGLGEEVRQAARDRVGVLLAPGEALDKIVPHLGELALVALAFPAFNDGRSFSKAELLRSRHGFRRAVRATGQVLVDQLPHMIRVGFDEFEVSHPVLLERLEAGRIGGLPHFYQPAATPADPGPRYSWRRNPRGQEP
ncbi:MAG: DUF934 domain-containing protein [Rhizobiaceae bacterium]|nr:DUF934 domain-containing protein [Rhizobiaceae bacterium]